MIEILTLMLGILVGSSTVELRVGDQVERVKVRVDNQDLFEVHGPPWRFEVEWGEAILPRVLEVIAYSATGEELGRDSRWINLRSSEAMARLNLPPPDAEGRVSHATVRWAVVGVERPHNIVARLDDQALTVGFDGKIQLPTYDPSRFHWLSVEVDFGDIGKEVLGASLGGETLVELSTQLTAVPVQVDSRRALRKLPERIFAEGRPVPIHGVDKGSADVVMVLDQDAVDHLMYVAEESGKSGIEGTLKVLHRAGGRKAVEEARERDLARFGTLGADTRLHFVWPQAASWSGPRLTPSMFVSDPPRSLTEAGLLAATHRREAVKRRPKIAAAVAIAGLSAATGSRRRAVVLVARDLRGDHSADVKRVVGYLEALKVPLFVWTVGTDADPGSWPEPRHLMGLESVSRAKTALSDAIDHLRESLDSQRMVWLEGQFLPQDITLAPDLKGARWPAGTGGKD